MSEMQDLPDVLAGSTDRLKNMGETGTGMPGVMPASMSRSLNINTQENGMELAMEMNPKMTSSMTMAGSNNSLNKQPRRNYAHRSRVDLATKEKEREEKIRKMRELQEEQRKKKLEELKQHALHAQKFREQQEVERRRHIEELRSRDMDRRAQVEERRREIERAEFDRREAILAKNRERAERIESQRRNSRGQLELAFGSSAPRLMEGHRDSSSWATRSTYDRRSSERELDLKSKRTTSAQGLDRNTEGDDTSPLSLAATQPTAHRRRTDLIPTGGFGGSGMLYQRVNSRGVSGANTPGRAASASRLDILAQPKCLMSVTSMASSGVASSKSMITLANINNPATKTAGVGHNHNNNKMTASLHAAFKTTLSSRPSATTAAKLGATFSVRRERAMTSGNTLNKKSAGLSRENSVTTSRPSSAMSGGGPRAGAQAQVRLRPSTAGRRPRPLSIATTGMTSSMYEERQKPFLRNKSSATPKLDRSKRARSINGEQIDDDQRSNGSSTGCGPVGSAPVRPSSARKTPAQVKAENAARRAKMSSRPKLDANNSGHNSKEMLDSTADLRSADSKDKMAGDLNGGDDGISGGGERQITPDIIKGQDSSKSESSDDREAEVANDTPVTDAGGPGAGGDKESSVEKEEKRKIITSEEEAKARIAEKRKEMKEKMEREAEIERLRLEAEAAAEEEQRRKEEEEERRMIEETERLAAEARRQEEERINKAMEEEAERVRLEKEEEERLNKEKEEAEKKAKEEAEKREKELIELEEKRRVEEEERLRRKARVEAIMARTRGKGGTPTGTPKKEADKNEDSISQNSQPPSLDTNVDPTKPDLLGDITEPSGTSGDRTEPSGQPHSSPPTSLDTQVNHNSDNNNTVVKEMAVDNTATTVESDVVDGSNTNNTDPVATEDQLILDLNNTNSSSNDHVIENGVSVTADAVENGDSAIATTKEAMNGVEEGLEKGALDSLSNKSEDSSETESHKLSSNHSQLIEVDNGKISALENDFDQILDLSAERTVTDVSGAPQPPIIAFEANTQPQADLLS